MEEKTYKTQQVANILGVDKSTLLRWIRAGKLGDVTTRSHTNSRVWTEKDLGRAKEHERKIRGVVVHSEEVDA